MIKSKTEKDLCTARGMVMCIVKEGLSEAETAKEFNTSKDMVRRRLKMLGYTYADLVDMREARKKKGATV